MKSYLVLSVWLILVGTADAGEIRRGASMQVKPDSIWFEDRSNLARWQVLKKAGDSKALASYQDSLLQAREAWQFSKPLTVRIRGFEPKAHLVDVEMQTEGRLQGSTWCWIPARSCISAMRAIHAPAHRRRLPNTA
ncbi:hypothetical protein [Tardiphaga sp. 813_E8_N1_3]|uniref:hypothetical protein n=1 Tax=Tardiphaga sp. 813_E8_N1_3 TaxID=3240760 RepID=UPI003F2227F9